MEHIKKLLSRAEPVKWLFCGDSITHGAFHTFGARDYTQHFAERVRFEMNRSQDIVINTAISGDTSRGLLKGFPWRIGPFSPDVVFLMIGMNDCSKNCSVEPGEFSSNLHDLCGRIAALGGAAVLQTACPIVSGRNPDREPYFPDYMQAVRDVAAARNSALVDHEAHWLANASKHEFWMSNAFHPNRDGHLAMAHFLFQELGIFDPASTTCRLFVP